MQTQEESNQMLVAAVQNFENALLVDPQNDTARTLLATTQLALFLNDNVISPSTGCSALCALLDGFGAGQGGRNLFNFGLTFPTPLPANSPTGADVQTFNDVDLIPVLISSATLLEAVAVEFSDTVELFGSMVELDYGDAMVAAAALRAIQINLESTLVLETTGDIDAIASATFPLTGDGVSYPYRIFSGDTPTNIVQGQECPITDPLAGPNDTRPGFLNDVANAMTMQTFLTRPNAGAKLESLRQGLIALSMNYIAGSESIIAETDPQDDDLVTFTAEQACQNPFVVQYLQGVITALSGSGVVVIPAVTSPVGNPCQVDLPQVTYNNTLAWEAGTYAGRPFLPDYTLSMAPQPCVADVNSFPDPTFGGAFPSLDAVSLLEGWNEANRLWDTLLFGRPVDAAY